MDFRSCLEKLEAAGLLSHVQTEVDLDYEMAGLARKFEGKQVLVFDKLKGQEFPLAIGLWWNRDNLA